MKYEMKEPQDLQKLLTQCTDDTKLLTHALPLPFILKIISIEKIFSLN